jgi:hypothetical protein
MTTSIPSLMFSAGTGSLYFSGHFFPKQAAASFLADEKRKMTRNSISGCATSNT